MSIIRRSVALKGKPEIKDFFCFVNVEVTIGLNLATVILDKLNQLKIAFEDCRGQAPRRTSQNLELCSSHVEHIL